MARYLASYLRWAKKTAPGVAGTQFPTYGESMDMGPLASVAEAINSVSADNFGSNQLREHVDEFVSVGLTAVVTEMPIDSAVAVYGATKNKSGGISFGSDDEPPEGGLGLVSGKQVVNGKTGEVRKRYFQGVFWPNVTGSRQGTTFATKGSSITFENATCIFTGTTEENGYHTVFSGHFSTEAEAKAWVDKMLQGGADALAEAKAAGDS